MKITIKRNQLIAALCTSAIKDVRYYLQGVLVEASAKETRLISTDGSCMSIQRALADAKQYKFEENEVDPGFSGIIIPCEVAKMVKAHKASKFVTLIGEGDHWTLVDSGFEINFKPVDGRFPNWRIVATGISPSGETAQFEAARVAQFSKASTALGCKGSILITHNGDKAGLVSIGKNEEYVGIIMPFSYKELPEKLLKQSPEWLLAA